ncbi:MAG: chemotaxis protein CheX [Planctomycetaceae bacterium]
MAIDTPTMRHIISNVFDEMLALPTQELGAPGDEFSNSRVVASIRISGAAEELIIVEAPSATASLIGETMFDAEPGTLADEEIRDAVGEVVNMIGGNVKGIHDGDSQLSLPCVSEECGAADDQWDGCELAAVSVSGLPLLVRWMDMCPAAT